MRKNKYVMLAMKLVVIVVASIIYAVGISLFLDPNNLAPGGVTGISVILNRLTGAPTGTIYFLINIPIVILGIWKWCCIIKVDTLFSRILIYNHNQYENRRKTYGTESKIL